MEKTDFFSEMNCYISVDVETAGPNPSDYAMLSIGACTIMHPRQTFYCELKPDRQKSDPSALEICRLSMDELQKNGTDPEKALQDFEGWLSSVVPAGKRPLFVAFNAPFDWMFVNDYFFRYLNRNPFGHSAIDTKAVYMGCNAVPWSGTSMKDLQLQEYEVHPLSHNALQDAIDQADIFEAIFKQLVIRSAKNA